MLLSPIATKLVGTTSGLFSYRIRDAHAIKSRVMRIISKDSCYQRTKPGVLDSDLLGSAICTENVQNLEEPLRDLLEQIRYDARMV